MQGGAGGAGHRASRRGYLGRMLTKQEIRAKYEAVAGLYDRMEAVVEWLGVRALRRDVFGRARGRVRPRTAWFAGGRTAPFIDAQGQACGSRCCSQRA